MYWVSKSISMSRIFRSIKDTSASWCVNNRKWDVGREPGCQVRHDSQTGQNWISNVGTLQSDSPVVMALFLVVVMTMITHTLCLLWLSPSGHQSSSPSSSLQMWEIKLTRRYFYFPLGSNMQIVTLVLNPPLTIVVTTAYYSQYFYIYFRYRTVYLSLVVIRIEILRIVSVVCQTVSNLNDLMPHFPHIN